MVFVNVSISFRFKPGSDTELQIRIWRRSRILLDPDPQHNYNIADLNKWFYQTLFHRLFFLNAFRLTTVFATGTVLTIPVTTVQYTVD
jgi:hypothetical protein